MFKNSKMIIVFSIVLVFLTSCLNKNTSENNNHENNIRSTNEINNNNVDKESIKNDIVEDKSTINDTSSKESGMLAILKNSFSGFATIEFNKEYKVYHLIPTDPNFENDILTIYNNPNDSELMEIWNELIYRFKDGSKLIQNELGDGYGVALVNPSNKDNYLILAKDGVIVYDFIHDGNH